MRFEYGATVKGTAGPPIGGHEFGPSGGYPCDHGTLTLLSRPIEESENTIAVWQTACNLAPMPLRARRWSGAKQIGSLANAAVDRCW
ncbi:hypothetical protein AWC22_15830 [Mycobacterium riyadhense]|uniref:Uncharacterized protein n=1 Tax=Mycobacterium riyadhense TaxID=486698 RepID=A0A1X2D2I0_9MYCO|nr:hypothetical protein AWC22_15830 [Mycobacterium riyadhense]